ncbi:MAG TPA: hypothetical protein VE913_13730 [Longimicrobium sp.]|nr:hypothetical protein [Longimicrobium sp.]
MSFEYYEEGACDFALPAVVDTSAVVFLSMLAGRGRAMRLDASAVREIGVEAAPLLVSLLETARGAGYAVGITGASAMLRRRWGGGPLATFLISDCAEELLFVCPDREAIGFHPSPR